MKIQHYKAIAAIRVLQELGNKNLPAKVSFGLFKVRRGLLPVWEFQVEQENKLLDKYGEDIGDGRKQIKSEEGRKAFDAMLFDLNSQEEDIDFEPITMPLPDINMSIDQIEILSEFINFTE